MLQGVMCKICKVLIAWNFLFISSFLAREFCCQVGVCVEYVAIGEWRSVCVALGVQMVE